MSKAVCKKKIWDVIGTVYRYTGYGFMDRFNAYHR